MASGGSADSPHFPPRASTAAMQLGGRLARNWRAPSVCWSDGKGGGGSRYGSGSQRLTGLLMDSQTNATISAAPNMPTRPPTRRIKAQTGMWPPFTRKRQLSFRADRHKRANLITCGPKEVERAPSDTSATDTPTASTGGIPWPPNSVLTGSGSASVISPMFVPTPSYSRPLAAGLRGSGTCSVTSMPPVTPAFESLRPLLPEALQIKGSVVSGGAR